VVDCNWVSGRRSVAGPRPIDAGVRTRSAARGRWSLRSALVQRAVMYSISSGRFFSSSSIRSSRPSPMSRSRPATPVHDGNVPDAAFGHWCA